MHQKLLKISRKCIWWSWISIKFPYSLKPTTGLKTPPLLLFWKCSERTGCSKITKIQKKKKKKKKKKKIWKNVFSSLTLQAWSSEFPTSTKTNVKKNVSYECSEIAENLPRKGLWWNFIKVARLLSRVYTLLKKLLHTFFRGCSEKLLFATFWEIPRKTSLVQNFSFAIYN